MHQRGDFPVSKGWDQHFDLQPGKNRNSQFRADSGDTEQLLKQVFFPLRSEAVQGEGLLPNVAVNLQANFRGHLSQVVKSGDWDKNLVAYASSFNDDTIRPFREELPAQMGYHRFFFRFLFSTPVGQPASIIPHISSYLFPLPLRRVSRNSRTDQRAGTQRANIRKLPAATSVPITPPTFGPMACIKR